MIDFKNGIIKLKKTDGGLQNMQIAPLLIDGETIISTYVSVRDFVAFTNKRLIVVNIQGLTGKKKDYSSLPYSKIQAFSVETSGVFDLDSELELWFSGLGKVKLEFTGSCDIIEIGKFISQNIL